MVLLLTGDSISSCSFQEILASSVIAGDIADRSLAGYMPQLQGHQLKDTQITGGQISTTSIGANGKSTALEMYNASQFEKPDAPHSVVTASDGSQWYQMASGAGAGAFYDAPAFMGSPSEAAQVAAAFPRASEGTTLRTVTYQEAPKPAIPCGTTVPTMMSRMRRIRLCSRQTV